MKWSNILIIKPSSLGDIVHCLGVIPSIRKAWPAARISWLVRPEFAALFDCIDGVDQRIPFDRKTLGRWFQPAGWQALANLIATLRSQHFDLVLDLQGLLRSALLAFVSGCPTRAGFANAREGARWFYTIQVPIPPSMLHMTDRCRALLNAMGITNFQPLCPLHPPRDATDQARQLLAQCQAPEFVVFVLGAAVPSKRWPIERFAQIAQKIYRQYHLPAVIVGTAADKPSADEFAKASGTPTIDLCGKTTLPQLIAILAGARLVVSNDTGPGHLAAYLGIPTVMIFGPTNPAWVAPINQRDGIAAIEPFSRPPTVRSADPKHHIDQVSVEIVWQTTERKLSVLRKH